MEEAGCMWLLLRTFVAGTRRDAAAEGRGGGAIRGGARRGGEELRRLDGVLVAGRGGGNILCVLFVDDGECEVLERVGGGIGAVTSTGSGVDGATGGSGAMIVGGAGADRLPLLVREFPTVENDLDSSEF